MKTIKKLSAMLFIAGAALFTACNTGNDGKPDPEPPTTGLELQVDKTSLKSDGSDKAKFTVYFTSESGMQIDVTSSAIITYNDGVDLGGNQFSSTEAGEYKFVATYTKDDETYTSNEVIVNVSALTLASDVEVIGVNGTSVATFTVTYNGEDVTSESAITNITLDDKYTTGVNTFSSPGYSGEFKFKATYHNMESNEVVVKVEPMAVGGLRLKVDKARVASGESVTFTVIDLDNNNADVTSTATLKTVDGTEISNPYTVTGNVEVVAEMTSGEGTTVTSPAVSVGTGNFWKRVLVNKFTSIGCTYCPMAASAIEGAKTNFPNRIVEVAVHALSMGQDPMAPANLQEYMTYFAQLQTYRLPYIFFDFVPDNMIEGAGSTNAVLGFVKPLAQMTAEVGISGEASADDNGNVNVKVNVQAAVAGEYYLCVQLLENGISYTQAGAQGTYIHNYTLRETFSETISGDNIGNLGVNQVVTKEYSMDTKNKYVLDNCVVVCYVCAKDSEGGYYAANAIEIPMNGWADCSFE